MRKDTKKADTEQKLAEAALTEAAAVQEAEIAEEKKEDDKLHILYVTPECTPFAHSGGLGEVAGSLPGALNRLRPSAGDGHKRIDCRVIMPLYEQIPEKFRNKMKYLGYTNISITWRQQYVGLYELHHEGVTYYFIDNEYYFKREGLYGYYDDGERFAFFSKAVFAAMEMMNFHPQIIHCNDWQTAMVPVWQTAVYHLTDTKTVFSVHNIEYQGNYGLEFNDNVLGLPSEEVHLVEFGGGINLMKGGIECANVFSTVSPTYAEELKDPIGAFGLDGIVRRNESKLTGILNGINVKDYDPSADPDTAAPYAAKDLSGKAACKQELQRYLGLPERDVPIIAMISRLVPAKGVDIIQQVMDDIMEQYDAQFVLLGTGNPGYENWFRGLEVRHPDRVRSLIMFNIPLSHQIYAGSDILLVPSRSEPCGLTQMIGCRYGTIPIVRATGGLKDSITDCRLGEGNGFVFENYDPESLRKTIIDAIGLYQNKEDWQKLAAYAMRQDFSWSHSAKLYREMYENM
ncbi:MAG: glycogen synthase [Lachnospiraceae bacterium]|nr:glycogen synthase [Lachnospiraceae bacterium]